jgi:quinol monooxygenase YgiN
MKKALFIFIFAAAALQAVSYNPESITPRSANMPGHVFVVSEWLPKENCEQELWSLFKTLMSLTLDNERGCVRAHATRQIAHPGAPGKSKFKIILLQEFVDIDAFNVHCNADYVTHLAKKYILDEETSLVQDWTCRLFSEEE